MDAPLSARHSVSPKLRGLVDFFERSPRSAAQPHTSRALLKSRLNPMDHSIELIGMDSARSLDCGPETLGSTRLPTSEGSVDSSDDCNFVRLISGRRPVPRLKLPQGANTADGIMFWLNHGATKVFTYSTWFYSPLTQDEVERIQGSKCVKCAREIPPEGLITGLANQVSELLGFRRKEDAHRRLCHFTGFYFCSRCHTMATRIVPSYVMHYGRAEPLPVCDVAARFLSENTHIGVMDADAMHGVARSARPDICLLHRLSAFLRRLKMHFVTLVERHRPEVPACAPQFGQSLERFLVPYYHMLPYDWPSPLISVQELELLGSPFLKALEALVAKWFDHCYKVR
ncbi:MAG: uncharacterized protein KVP18_000775 [Porospora cf. gigantea A]|uniref:uncharacterized protein n=1 Tax=Porospora cf. gigantea A TaxID=2853593 RepID=UPI00355A30E6|nr:MAG: hypothetical protein KVP18_000775 [Porospora cf. gigantea A]